MRNNNVTENVPQYNIHKNPRNINFIHKILHKVQKYTILTEYLQNISEKYAKKLDKAV